MSQRQLILTQGQYSNILLWNDDIFCSYCAPTIYREPAFGSPDWPHLLGLDESAGKSSSILFHYSTSPLTIPFCHWLHLPLGMPGRNARHYKGCTAVCAHCSSPLLLQGKAIPYMASHAKAVTLIMWWAALSVFMAGTSSVQMEVNTGMRIWDRESPTATTVIENTGLKVRDVPGLETF